MYPEAKSRSAQLYERARKVLPGGNSRTSVFFEPYPVYAAAGHGSRIVDVDGVERIDFVNNYTSLIHGHAHPRIVAAVTEQLHRGSCFAAPTESEIALAEILVERLPAVDQVRFANSGSEGVMMAIKAARGYTGRGKIAKCEGAYHGSYDFAEVSQGVQPQDWGDPDAPRSVPPSRGTPQSVLDEVIVIPYNDSERARRILTPRARELVAIVIDPMSNQCGMVPATPEYLRFMRAFTRAHGIVLIFDEVISFRLDYHGAQGAFACEPDLTALGKVIGCGFPVGAVGGKAEVMAVFDPSRGKPPVPHAGTFNANPITMTAGRVALEMLTREAYQRLNALGDRARAGLEHALAAAGVPGTVTGRGSLFRLFLAEKKDSGYRAMLMSPKEAEMMAELHRYLLNHGFFFSSYGLGNISTAHTEAEIDQFVETVRNGLGVIKQRGLAAE
ncbi:MAG: aspartate aminotransferase family protein [Alphaproteobacteria bacterium]|nr:aspartate aminotransferase family protein [Alphaproteobacteria bacterium]